MTTKQKVLLGVSVGGAVMALIAGLIVYDMCRVNVRAGEFAVLTRKTGLDIENGQSVAPDKDHKGVQLDILTEGRHFINPYTWDASIYPMVNIPDGKMGVRTRLYGENLPYGDFLAVKETQKGIVPDVLRPGRYAINAVIKGKEAERPKGDYVEMVEIVDPVTIPPGFRGIVTNLSGPVASDPNVVLVKPGERGVQKETLEAGTYYLNPYSVRVHIIDCRSQRFNLSENGIEMGFPSKDGFWISLDGVIEFRILPEKAAEVFVLYNEDSPASANNDHYFNIQKEIVRKIIMPNARSFCRITGSDKSGRDFIGGDTRTDFQKNFHGAMKKSCDPEGVEIVHALITKINPPQAIAKPVRDREVARQKQLQYKEQKLQQDAEAKLATEKALVKQRQDVVGVEQKVIQDVTKAKQDQQVAVTKAEENKAVAQQNLEAAKDQAAAKLAAKKAEAGVIELQNQAEAAGWKKAVDAFGGDGEAFARYVLYQKIAPAFKSMMLNTADTPLMRVFEGFTNPNQRPVPGAPRPAAPAPVLPAALPNPNEKK